ncbi:MAG: hypothetical protein DRP06_00920 [Candidatus Aenigmatarchaeota archaeon]|nr:MAG: hypothetical protein DRP06_00920 [Candidatus Aenigmarchaeota archaeon]
MEEIREDYSGLCGRLVEAGVYDSLEEVKALLETLIKSGIYDTHKEAVNGVENVVEFVEGLGVAEKYLLKNGVKYDPLSALVEMGVYGSIEDATEAAGWFKSVENSGMDLC